MVGKAYTPLRYPGGKSLFSDYFKSYINLNIDGPSTYAEPYCGGAGAAVNLLIEGEVTKILLNDANYSIYAFWASLKHFGEKFLEIFDQTEITLDEWKKQRVVLINSGPHSESNLVKQGFATFFNNRCNRSGILTSGPIGGQSAIQQENANYKIDARFQKKLLREKIVRIIEVRDQIEVYNLDALIFLKTKIESLPIEAQTRTFVYLDPPYYNQGSGLYFNSYKPDDHKVLSRYLKNDLNYKWLLSYDNVPSIRALYSEFDQFSFYINYSAQQSKLGSELLIPSKNSVLPASGIIKKTSRNKTIELTYLHSPSLFEIIE